MSKINFLCVMFLIKIGCFEVFAFNLAKTYISSNVSQVFVGQTFTLKCMMPANGQSIDREISMLFFKESTSFYAKFKVPGKTQNKLFFNVKN